jgi:hypothetical protein
MSTAVASNSPSTSSSAIATKGSNKPLRCNESIYRYFPGEYAFCEALSDENVGRYDRMVENLKDASGWGQKRAQFTLGIMYFNGQHVPSDHARGLAWMALAAERHDPGYLGVFSSAYNRSTPAERQRADGLLRELRQRYGDHVAATRAARHFRRERQKLARQEANGGTVCIAGMMSIPNLSGLVDIKQETAYEDRSVLHHHSMLRGVKRNSTFESARPGAAPSCPSAASVLRTMDKVSARYFDGWRTHVDVGPIRQAALPAEGAGK